MVVPLLPLERTQAPSMMSVFLVLVFFLGAGVGAGLNLCVRRLPYEKSLLWPGPRCPQCHAARPWTSLIPILGFFGSRRCTPCGAYTPRRHLVVELFTGMIFVGLYLVDVVYNVPQLATGSGWANGIVFLHHAVLISFLLAASLVDLEHYEIPLPVTLTGTLVGLVFSILVPWPWPEAPVPPTPLPRLPIGLPLGAHPPTQTGLYPCPFWHPLPPAFLPGGNWQTGLATGVIGLFVGTFLLRGVRFVFGLGRGKEGLGVGDADLMMMAGSFLGWQVVVVAFFVSVFPALLIGILQTVLRGEQELAFGPSLSLGVVLTMVAWPWIGPRVGLFFFDATILTLVTIAGAGFLFFISFFLRIIRGTGDQEPA